MSTGDLDRKIAGFMRDHGAVSATLGYRGYPKSCCISVNHVVNHGIPSDDKRLRDGDIANIDVTCVLDGWYGDTSRMYVIGERVPVKAMKLVEITFECMWAGIRAVRPGATLGDVGHAIQTIAEANRCSVVRDFVGHGLGRVFHDAPEVKHYGNPGEGLVLRPGMLFTIEPMINAGRPEVKILGRRLDHRHPRPLALGPVRAHGGRDRGRGGGVHPVAQRLRQAAIPAIAGGDSAFREADQACGAFIPLACAFLLGSAGLAQAADAESRFQAYGLGALYRARRFTDLCEVQEGGVQAHRHLDRGLSQRVQCAVQGHVRHLALAAARGAVAEFTFNVCKENPQVPMLEVVNALIRDLPGARAASRPPPTGRGSARASSRWRSIATPSASMQERLIELGFLKGKADGAFGPGTEAAVEAFQKAAGLPRHRHARCAHPARAVLRPAAQGQGSAGPGAAGRARALSPHAVGRSSAPAAPRPRGPAARQARPQPGPDAAVAHGPALGHIPPI